MPYQNIPGTTTKWRPAAESLADPKMRMVQLKDGTYTGYRQDGWSKLGDVMNFAIPAMMGYGALSAAGVVPSVGGAGGGSGLTGGAAMNAQIDGLMAGTPSLGGLKAGAGASYLGGKAINSQVDRLMGGAGGALGNVGDRVLNALTSEKGIGSLASLLPMLMASRSLNNGANANANAAANTPQLQQLLDMSTQRAQRTDPLHQMVTRLAESRMPINSRG